MKRTLLILLTSLLILGMVTSATSAQRGDRDGDGVPDDVDRCPDQPGPRDNDGCPILTPLPPRDSDGDGVPDDSDGCPTVPGPASNGGCPETAPAPGDQDDDGIPDNVDSCPDVSGIAANNGCPAEAPPDEVPTAVPTIPLPALPTSGDCMLATLGGERVNIRAQASTDSEIVGTLDPTLLYPVYAQLLNDEGLWDRIDGGWVADWVVRKGGLCDLLPYVEQGVHPAIDPTSPDITELEFEIVGIDPTADLLAGFCTNNLQLAAQLPPNAASGDSAPPMMTFTWGTFNFESSEWCIQDENSVPGWEHTYEMRVGKYVITDYNFGGEDTAYEGWPCKLKGFVLDGHGGDASEIVIQAIFTPPPGGDLPPDPGAPGIIIEWHIPFDPAADGTHVLYQDVFIPPPSPQTGDLVLSWGSLAEEVEQTEGSPDNSAEVNPGPPNDQGIIIDFTPDGDVPPDPGVPSHRDDSDPLIQWYIIKISAETNTTVLDDLVGSENVPFDPNAQGIIIDYLPVSIGGVIKLVVQ